MDIKKFYDCEVKLFLNDGRIIIGRVLEYYYEDENENGQQSIVLDSMAYDEPIEVFDEEIANIVLYEGV